MASLGRPGIARAACRCSRSAPIWLRPIIQREASAAFRRPITIGSVRLHLGNPLTMVFENLVVGNPPGFPENEEPFARIARVSADVDTFALIRRGQLVITSIDLQQPIVRPVSTVEGQRNYVFPPSHPDIDVIRVTDGHAHVTLADLRADFQVDFATRPASDPAGATQIVATSQGTYAALPTTARLVGDGVVHSGEGAQPWSVDLQITNGQTEISAVGSLQDPTNPRGAKLILRSTGPDMALLKPLIGVSLPTTPHYEFDVGFAYEGGVFTVTGKADRIGRSDLEGTVTVRTGEGGQAAITAELHSGNVAIEDITSLISGRPSSNEQKTAAETPMRQGSGLLPKATLHLPDVGSSILHLTYAAPQLSPHLFRLKSASYMSVRPSSPESAQWVRAAAPRARLIQSPGKVMATRLRGAQVTNEGMAEMRRRSSREPRRRWTIWLCTWM